MDTISQENKGKGPRETYTIRHIQRILDRPNVESIVVFGALKETERQQEKFRSICENRDRRP
jgi:hypothetical protein